MGPNIPSALVTDRALIALVWLIGLGVFALLAVAVPDFSKQLRSER